jgi:hypothetical protein
MEKGRSVCTAGALVANDSVKYTVSLLIAKQQANEHSPGPHESGQHSVTCCK